ncbi:hypothetical protein [Oerskovia turbata]
MTYEEKGIWVYVAVVLATYGAYLAVVISRLGTGTVASIDYAAPLLWSIGASIAAAVLLRIGVEIVRPSESHDADARDRDIDHAGELVGRWPLIVGAAGALALTLAQSDHFWIANAIYLGFAASAVLASAVKITFYRRGL